MNFPATLHLTDADLNFYTNFTRLFLLPYRPPISIELQLYLHLHPTCCYFPAVQLSDRYFATLRAGFGPIIFLFIGKSNECILQYHSTESGVIHTAIHSIQYFIYMVLEHAYRFGLKSKVGNVAFTRHHSGLLNLLVTSGVL